MPEHLRGASYTTVEVLPGTGAVARYGDVVLWWEPGPTAPTDLAARLVGLVKDLAAEEDTAAATAGGRLAGVLREIDAQAVAALALAAPSPTGLRVVVHGTGQVLATGVEITRGWEDKEIGWPDSLALGRGDGQLRPPTPGSPYDLVLGGAPGGGAAIALVARLAPPAAVPDAAEIPVGVPSIAAPDLAAPVQPLLPEPPAPPLDPPPVTVDPITVPPMDPTILATGAPTVVPVAAAPSTDAEAEAARAPSPSSPTPSIAEPWVAAPPVAETFEAGSGAGTGASDTVAVAPVAPPPVAPDATLAWSGPVDADAMATMPLAAAAPMPGPPVFSAAGPTAPSPARPPEAVYGAIVLDDGSVWPLDADYVIGTSPGGSPDVIAGLLRAIPVVDPSGQAHPVHAEIRHGESGTLLLVARATTYVLVAGAATWQEAPLNAGFPLDAGVRVSVGQRTFTLAAPTS